MGLDITAYSGIKAIEKLKDEEEWEEKYWSAGKVKTVFVGHWIKDEFPEWSKGLVPGAVYEYKKYFRFRAGSYHGYNEWREWLCGLALGVKPESVWHNEKQYEDKPFYRLINFSDCQGVISYVYALPLMRNFKKYQEVVDQADCDPWYKEQYANWRKAFELAAKNGFVNFG